MRQLQAETMVRSGLLALRFLAKYIHEVLGVVMVSFFAAAGNSCLAIRSLIVLKVRSLSTFS